jgi:UDP-N-acetyl-2-amino-2-deoxyglucuronate dehydrogenase
MGAKEVKFSNQYAELHTHSYLNILNGNGFSLEDCKKSFEIVSSIRCSIWQYVYSKIIASTVNP